eukprot:CAMPEP_0206826244 /NCGR_PEP_ID=MMETSP0975-20121206/14749_1 /ASSEMBLY_ACC=CAM_ASM_000399 /TAXON_ID=483370 /ORGANISM="non described non described, Strain CCMP2097" /LENGTH=110 /DNA_ID=CAMNT_0054368543 /DNA_START=134 /DNA_END=463 /DNA_ORIENTATION=-
MCDHEIIVEPPRSGKEDARSEQGLQLGVVVDEASGREDLERYAGGCEIFDGELKAPQARGTARVGAALVRRDVRQRHVHAVDDDMHARRVVHRPQTQELRRVVYGRQRGR